MNCDFVTAALFSGETWQIVRSEFPAAIGQTLMVVLLTTLAASLIGVPLGVLLVTGQENGIRPLPKWLMRLLNGIINLLRSVPFLILIIVVIPVTRAIAGTIVGPMASIVPLTIASFPYVARVTESALREVDPNVIEMAQSLGASPFQIVTRVMIPESVPGLISNAAITLTNVLGYQATTGMLGGGGLGKIAIDYGYYRYRFGIMILAVAVLVIIVQIIQHLGSWLSQSCDKRLRR
jgi:D-methionine transport system permease protein